MTTDFETRPPSSRLDTRAQRMLNESRAAIEASKKLISDSRKLLSRLRPRDPATTHYHKSNENKIATSTNRNV
jgi:hypothetical protein